ARILELLHPSAALPEEILAAKPRPPFQQLPRSQDTSPDESDAQGQCSYRLPEPHAVMPPSSAGQRTAAPCRRDHSRLLKLPHIETRRPCELPAGWRNAHGVGGTETAVLPRFGSVRYRAERFGARCTKSWCTGSRAREADAPSQVEAPEAARAAGHLPGLPEAAPRKLRGARPDRGDGWLHRREHAADPPGVRHGGPAA